MHLRRVLAVMLLLPAGGCGSRETLASSPTSSSTELARSIATSAATLVLRETFNDLDGNGDGFDQPGWATFRSAFGVEASGASFVTDGAARARFLRIVRVPGLDSNGVVDYSPYAPPSANAGQWPYLMDLLDGSQCKGAVNLLARTKPYVLGEPTQVYGVLINYRVTGEGSHRALTGYQLLVNGGGQSVTLSRFIDGFDHSFDYLDRFPGCTLPAAECTPPPPNPLIDGPYKGWDYRAGGWPAGGNPALLNENVIAVRYEYDVTHRTVTLRWELRPPDGSDNTPDSWDMNRVLDGDDAFPPGGSYGYFATLYSSVGATSENGLFVSEFSLSCEDR